MRQGGEKRHMCGCDSSNNLENSFVLNFFLYIPEVYYEEPVKSEKS